MKIFLSSLFPLNIWKIWTWRLSLVWLLAEGRDSQSFSVFFYRSFSLQLSRKSVLTFSVAFWDPFIMKYFSVRQNLHDWVQNPTSSIQININISCQCGLHSKVKQDRMFVLSTKLSCNISVWLTGRTYKYNHHNTKLAASNGGVTTTTLNCYKLPPSNNPQHTTGRGGEVGER